jgi:hypothetical protein
MFQGVSFGLGMDLSYKYVNAFLGSDNPANAAEPDATAHLLMDGPLYNTFGVPSSLFIGGQSWRKLTPAAISNGKQSYTYGDERVSWDGYRWSYVNIPNLLNPWAQLGADIDGEAADDQSGYSVSMNAAGDRVAIGAHLNDGNGHVRVYSWNSTAWTKLGADIDGEAVDDLSGVSVSMNAAGDRVAIGANGNDGNGSNSGHVRVYSWNGTAWTQLGADLDGEAVGDWSGYSVSMNAAGDRVAIGANLNDENGSNSGHVRVYSWNGTAWAQLGLDIDGEAADDLSGVSVSMNAAGDRVAIGARLNDGNGSNSGHVRVYSWNGTAWAQLGLDIDGEAVDDQSGYSVSMNAAGDRVAIGARLNDGNGSASGHVRVYSWNGTAWTKLGLDIDGEAVDDRSGYSVSMNAAGDRVAIGANLNSSASGHVRVYSWNGTAWTKLGADIDGEAAGDQSGYSVSMNAAGDRVAIGAWLNDGNGSASGHVRVYRDTSIFATSSADVGRPWLATWTNGFSAAKVTPTYTKSTNYPTIP